MFEVDNRMGLIEPVLLNNGFIETNNLNFTNGNCEIEVDLENEIYNLYYKDINKVKFMVTSDNLNLYWLFGFLSAHDLVSRNFKL